MCSSCETDFCHTIEKKKYQHMLDILARICSYFYANLLYLNHVKKTFKILTDQVFTFFLLLSFLHQSKSLHDIYSEYKYIV